MGLLLLLLDRQEPEAQRDGVSCPSPHSYTQLSCLPPSLTPSPTPPYPHPPLPRVLGHSCSLVTFCMKSEGGMLLSWVHHPPAPPGTMPVRLQPQASLHPFILYEGPELRHERKVQKGGRSVGTEEGHGVCWQTPPLGTRLTAHWWEMMFKKQSGFIRVCWSSFGFVLDRIFFF